MGNSQPKQKAASKASRGGRKHDEKKAESVSSDGTCITLMIPPYTLIQNYNDTVREKYRVDHSELGHGHYGVVRKCQNRQTKEYFAVKTIKKSKVGRLETLKREIEILKTMDHPNIIRLVDVFEDDKYLHLVTELCTGGEVCVCMYEYRGVIQMYSCLIGLLRRQRVLKAIIRSRCVGI